MTTLNLTKYGLIISDKSIGNEIYTLIKTNLSRHKIIKLDLASIKSMAIFNIKQIFGRLYLELGSNAFFENLFYQMHQKT